MSRPPASHSLCVWSTVPVREGPRPVWCDRLVACAFAAAAVACTGILLGLEPDARGYDTHTQLGLSPCSWPGTLGIPCPTCGATTAACLLVHGRPFTALAVQPFGAALAAAGLLAGAAALWCLLRGRSFLDLLVQVRLHRLAFFAAVLLPLAWLYKCLTFTPP